MNIFPFISRFFRFVYRHLVRAEDFVKHIKIDWSEGGINVYVQNHQQKLEELKDKIMAIKNTNEEEYIKTILSLAVKGCDFVAFVKKDRMVMFKTNRGYLDMTVSFKKNDTKNFYYLLGVLAKLKFVEKEILNTTFKYGADTSFHSYNLSETDENIEILAYFSKRYDDAYLLMRIIFKDIYKVDKSPLKLVLG